jgi:hypothetical protein
MDQSQRAVTDGNINRIYARLIAESDSKQRQTYCDILIAEEDRFANLQEQLEITQILLQRFDLLITRQEIRVIRTLDDQLRRDAEAVLQNHVETRRIFKLREERLLSALKDGAL